MFPILLFIVSNLYVFIVVNNLIGLNRFIIILFANILVTTFKILLKFYLLLKYRLNIKRIIGIRVSIMAVFFADLSFNMNYFMKSNEISYIVIISLINQVIMIVFILTKFHLWMFLLNLMINKFWIVFLKNKFLNIKNKIDRCFVFIWTNWHKFLERI